MKDEKQQKNNFVKRIAWVLVGIAALLMMPLFFLPMRIGMQHVGNITGLMGCSLVFALCIFHRPVMRWYNRVKRHRLFRVVRLMGIVLLACSFLWAGILSALMIHAMTRLPKSGAEMVIVLGCKVNGTTPSLMLTRRLEAAYDYATEHPSAHLIVSGGQGEDEWITEAAAMQTYLLDRGLDAQRITLEDRSTSTFENLLFSQSLIGDINEQDTLVIVTDGFHQYRAHRIARRLGYEPYAINARTPGWLVPGYFIREWFALSYDMVVKPDNEGTENT